MKIPHPPTPCALPLPRPLLALPEGRWPETIETGDLVEEVMNLHRNQMDFEEGDLQNRLWSFGRYKLQVMELADLDGEEWNWDMDTAKKYAAMEGPFPPIVYDPHDKSIIDGTHRVNSALVRGNAQIWAYVGCR